MRSWVCRVYKTETYPGPKLRHISSLLAFLRLPTVSQFVESGTDSARRSLSVLVAAEHSCLAPTRSDRPWWWKIDEMLPSILRNTGFVLPALTPDGQPHQEQRDQEQQQPVSQ